MGDSWVLCLNNKSAVLIPFDSRNLEVVLVFLNSLVQSGSHLDGGEVLERKNFFIPVKKVLRNS